ncbi:hypothetical protein [Acidithiobacillus sp. AMEEHan]|uniref:hypothetical protein n=1 Tax=Acidithiobacillus sp. AMEEHan TaxID=2994951 RepID=UPI0027E3F053|nr:hypothetical protein [Acidithiobacillus sp. AMEEHan]
MTIDEFLEKHPTKKSWKAFYEVHWGKHVHELWKSLADVEMSLEERFELFVSLMERLLHEKRLVLPTPDSKQRDWVRHEDGLYHVWCANVPVLLQYLRADLPSPSHPHFSEDIENPGSFPSTAWIGRGHSTSTAGVDEYETPMSLWTDGHCIAQPLDWKWAHLEEVPGTAAVRRENQIPR